MCPLSPDVLSLDTRHISNQPLDTCHGILALPAYYTAPPGATGTVTETFGIFGWRMDALTPWDDLAPRHMPPEGLGVEVR